MGASCQSSMSNCTIFAVPPAAAAGGAYSFLKQDCMLLMLVPKRVVPTLTSAVPFSSFFLLS